MSGLVFYSSTRINKTCILIEGMKQSKTSKNIYQHYAGEQNIWVATSIQYISTPA
jgi:hypothetical protein